MYFDCHFYHYPADLLSDNSSVYHNTPATLSAGLKISARKTFLMSQSEKSDAPQEVLAQMLLLIFIFRDIYLKK